MARCAAAIITFDVTRKYRYPRKMIVSYWDKRTEKFANGEFVRAFQGFAAQAERRLGILNAATCLDDLAALPSNRLEALGGDRDGQYSIRINKQCRAPGQVSFCGLRLVQRLTRA